MTKFQPKMVLSYLLTSAADPKEQDWRCKFYLKEGHN